MFNRPKGFCSCCGQEVEYYSDGLSGGGHPYRCGNCFEGITHEDLKRLGELQKKLRALDDQRAALLKNHQTGG